MTAPVSIFHVESPFRFQSLRERLTIRKNEWVDQIASGSAADYADYRHHVGILQGLDEALALIDEMEKNERN